MKNLTFVEIDDTSLKFDTVADAVEYMENADPEHAVQSFDITIRDNSLNIKDFYTIERNDRSGDFVYFAWYIEVLRVGEWDDRDADFDVYDGIEFNTAEDASCHKIAKDAISCGFSARACCVSMTLSEKIEEIEYENIAAD